VQRAPGELSNLNKLIKKRLDVLVMEREAGLALIRDNYSEDSAFNLRAADRPTKRNRHNDCGIPGEPPGNYQSPISRTLITQRS
jgi:hypothetical protein